MMFSPLLGLMSPRQPTSEDALPSRSPVTTSSPYKLPPIPKSNSSNDLVSGIVDKFNSLTVTDRDEERSMYERQIAKLKAALDRACMAREEAESEARRLREKLLELQEERVRERDDLKSRVSEWEKKYEKAKDRFKLQRAKNDEVMHKVQAEFLEKEKSHWRNVAVAEEAEEWERKLRVDAHDLLDFMQLEQRFSMAKGSVDTPEMDKMADSVVENEAHDKPDSRTYLQPSQARYHPRIASEEPDRTERFLTPDEDATNSAPQPDSRDVTPDGPPSLPIIPFRASQNHQQNTTTNYLNAPQPDNDTSHARPITPVRPVQRVPVDFGDQNDEDKENAAPAMLMTQAPATCGPKLMCDALSTPGPRNLASTGHAGLTPVTIDRAAALAAIEYRRGRAKSFVNANATPRKVSGLSLVDKRDLSAPVITMSVGRGNVR